MPKQYVSKAVGIDLGTTNSVVTLMNPTDTEVIIHKEGRRETTPSCVWKDPRSGEIIVGSKAFARIGHKPAPVRSIKRSMGRQTKVQLTNEEVTLEGAPIRVSLYIDEMAFITVKGTVGEHPFDFSVESPPDRALPAAPEIAALEQKLQDALATLSPEQRSQVEERRQGLKKSFYGAVTRGEEAQAVHEFEELEWLSDEISHPVRAALYPPHKDFDELIRNCHILNQEAARKANDTSYDFDSIEKAIEYQQQSGEEAFTQGNQQNYRHAFEALESLLNTIAASTPQDISPQTVEQGARMLLEYVLIQAAKLGEATRTYRRPDLQKQTEQIQKEGTALHGDIERDPARVQQRAQALLQHLDRINKLLMDTGSSDDGDIPLSMR